jgi:hypothetical protein
LLELKSGRFATIDKVLRHYLFSDTVAADKRPVFITHEELYNLTYQEPANSIIKDAAKRIAQQSRDKAKSVPVYSNKKRKRW